MKAPCRTLSVAAVAVFLSSPALAAGSSFDTSNSFADAASQPYRDGEKAIKAESWTLAVSHFEEAIELDSGSADAWNMLAFSQRQMGDMDSAFANNEKALQIDSEHKGAREYLIEAYLTIGDVDRQCPGAA